MLKARVSLPLVGAVEARGLTTSQLGSAIAGRLRSGYVRDPSVAVEIETYGRSSCSARSPSPASTLMCPI
jgi:protein involved in polysaccharide export with SLBB domain